MWISTTCVLAMSALRAPQLAGGDALATAAGMP